MRFVREWWSTVAIFLVVLLAGVLFIVTVTPAHTLAPIRS
jgi:hypothetical protein